MMAFKFPRVDLLFCLRPLTQTKIKKKKNCQGVKWKDIKKYVKL